MVYYRKYRPQTIDELDSEAVKKTLSSVLTHATIPHAFLFTGPKGLGKTSTARIVAKYVNCQGKGERGKGKDIQKPCNACVSCLSITEGTNLDVLEIDAASNRGIDEIRDLREKIRLLPVSSLKKVYIIDEVHMLTTEAFNALLKTLEEPPSHAMFILCTTEQQKVPATIISRCFHIQFQKASTADLVRSFERIIKAEKLDVERQILVEIASMADGSFRDGAKVLEEVVISSQGKKITQEMLETFYHAGSIDTDIISMITAFIDKNSKSGLEVVQHLIVQGTDIKFFLEKVLLYLHTVLLIEVGISSEKKTVEIDVETIKKLVAILSKAHAEIKSAVLPQLPLELAIMEWGEEEGKGEKGKGKVIEQKNEEPVIARNVVTKQSPSIKDDKTFLHQILDTIKGEHHMLAGVLRSCKMSQTADSIIIEVPSPFHKQRLEDKKALEVLEKVCEDITGKEVKISVVLKS